MSFHMDAEAAGPGTTLWVKDSGLVETLGSEWLLTFLSIWLLESYLLAPRVSFPIWVVVVNAKSQLTGKDPWCWERLKAKEEGSRGWGGWMASLTWWTWVWASSESWWWTGKPGLLQSMGSERVRHNWATELTWIENLVLPYKTKHSIIIQSFSLEFFQMSWKTYPHKNLSTYVYRSCIHNCQTWKQPRCLHIG